MFCRPLRRPPRTCQPRHRSPPLPPCDSRERLEGERYGVQTNKANTKEQRHREKQIKVGHWDSHVIGPVVTIFPNRGGHNSNKTQERRDAATAATTTHTHLLHRPSTPSWLRGTAGCRRGPWSGKAASPRPTCGSTPDETRQQQKEERREKRTLQENNKKARFKVNNCCRRATDSNTTSCSCLCFSHLSQHLGHVHVLRLRVGLAQSRPHGLAEVQEGAHGAFRGERVLLGPLVGDLEGAVVDRQLLLITDNAHEPAGGGDFLSGPVEKLSKSGVRECACGRWWFELTRQGHQFSGGCGRDGGGTVAG